MMLRIFILMCGGVSAFGLPGIYSQALSRQIDSFPLIKVISSLYTQIQYLLPLSGKEDIPKFYALIKRNQKVIEAPMRTACGGRRECMSLCSLLLTALELEYRERQLKELFSFCPSNISEGVLFQAQNIRLLQDLAPSNHKHFFTIKKKLDYVLLYLQLWEAIEGLGYGVVLSLVEERQMHGLRKYVQRSTDFYLNWLYRESAYVYPPLLNGTLPYWPDAATWYLKIVGSVFPLEMTPELLSRLLKNSLCNPILLYQANPGSFDIRSYFALVTVLLFLHQSHIELCINSGSGDRKGACMEIEMTLAGLYVLLEKLFAAVLNFMDGSTLLIFQVDLPVMSIMLTTQHNYKITRAEVFLVTHSPVDKFIVTKSGTLRINLLGIDKNSIIPASDIKDAVLAIFNSQRVFREDELNLYLEELVISCVKPNGQKDEG